MLYINDFVVFWPYTPLTKGQISLTLFLLCCRQDLQAAAVLFELIISLFLVQRCLIQKWALFLLKGYLLKVDCYRRHGMFLVRLILIHSRFTVSPDSRSQSSLMLVILSEKESNNFIKGMMDTRLLLIEPFSTPDRADKSKELSTARGSTSSNRYLCLDFEQSTSRDAKELQSLIQSSKRQLLQKFRKKQILEEQIQLTAVLDETFLQLHEDRRRIAISIAEDQMAIARYEREKEMLAVESSTQKDSVDEQVGKNHNFIEEAQKTTHEYLKMIEIDDVLKDIQPAVTIHENLLKMGGQIQKQEQNKIKKHHQSHSKMDAIESKDSQSSSQRSKESNQMSLIESMLADISKLKNLDQLLKEKEEQKRIVRCLMQMQRMNPTEPQQNQQSTLFN